MRPISRQTTKDMAVSAIFDYIRRNSLVPGDSLPTEGVLSEELQISRNIVREAMQHFRTLGIIETRQKVGSKIVRLFPEDPYSEYLVFLQGNSSALYQAAQVRMAVESGMARFIIERATAGDIAELESCCQAMESREAEDAVYHRNDIRFHRKLLQIPGNKFLNGAIQLVVDFMQAQVPDDVPDYKPGMARDNQVHRGMVEAIVNRDVEALRALFQEHDEGYLEAFSGAERRNAPD